MKITKFGHCCLLIEVDGVTILTDPGSFTTAQDNVTGVDIVLVSHEHGDHLHIDSLKKVLANNPKAVVISNAAVAALIQVEGIACVVVDGTATNAEHGVALAAFDGKHEEIYQEIGQVQNTGYLIANRLFYPGDSFHIPGVPVEILALPVAGPWCKLPDAIRYALAIKPKKAFPVHDAVLKNPGMMGGIVSKVLQEDGVEYTSLSDGASTEL
jgi:L-ascorbate metabolism protein UlaG (beta-lactamase superfamily)